MRQSTINKIVRCAAILSLIIVGCGQKNPSPIIKIGCSGPMTGDQAQLGIDSCRGVQLAIDHANEKGLGIAGYKLEALALDDQHNPAQAVNVAKKFISDRDVVAVVGHFNSSCTKPASAVYHESEMVQITAASTNPEISKQGFETFFRVAATDDVQGPRGANFASRKLGAKKIFVIDDKTTYGKGLADEFEKEARKLGIEVLGHEGITQGDKDFTSLLTKIKPFAPDLIYFGGIYPEGALLIRQARALGIQAIFMGGDGVAMPTFIEVATPEIAEGVYATMVGGDTKKLPSAQEFIRAYETKYGPVGQWSAYSYDAANIVISAIQKASKKDRKAILHAMREISGFHGVTGEIVFDKKGDNQNQFIGMFQVEKGHFVYLGPAE